jgi:glycosyltransferase involved in cell wall biosynthesis
MKVDSVSRPGSVRIAVLGSTYPRTSNDHEVPWLREWVKRLAARGHKVLVIAPAYRGLGDHVIDGVPVRRFRYAPSSWEILTHGEGAPNKLKKDPILKFLTLTYVLGGAYAAWKICQQERIDILHVHWPFPHGLMALLPAWHRGSKVVYSCHSAEFAMAAGSKISSAVLAFCLKQAEAITANSVYTARLVEEVSGRRPQIIPWGATIKVSSPTDTPVGANSGFFSNVSSFTTPVPHHSATPVSSTRTNTKSPSVDRVLTRSHTLPQVQISSEDVPLLLFSGRLVERKGVNFLLRAMALILQQRKVRLIITGDGHCRQEWEALARELGVDGAVRFAGFVANEELSSLFRSCTLYVHPAIYDSKGDTEGQGVVLVEALSNCKPVVACKVGGIVDVIKDGETGLLVPEKNPEAIAAAVLRLLNDPDYAQRLGGQGYAHAQNHFDWDRIMDQYDAIYRKCVLLNKQPTIKDAQPVTR